VVDEGLSLQDIIRRRQESDFVGREKRLVEFSENLRLPLTDHRRRFVFNVHGVAGVGKTFLTHQFRRVATQVDALCGYADESCFDVLETMTALAADFAAQDLPLKSFDKKLAVYHRRRHELEADPAAQSGVTRSAVEIGLAAARIVPVVGTAAGALDAKATADQVDRLRAHLSKKLRNSEDVQLLLSPAESLSKFFVSDLRKLAHDRPVALFFDTYERTAPFLEDWLLDLLNSRYGALPGQLVITIAGQKALGSNRWAPYRGIVADVPLVPFTDEEARKLLTARGVHDEHVVQLILSLSGRLPLWLATLADRPPAGEDDVTDPTDGAVERFLKWEPDEARRAIALSGALPRKLNEDVVGALCDTESPSEMFGWLRGLPFVTKTTSYWRYHDVARAPMLRLLRTQSPHRWRAHHHKLAAHFKAEREALPVHGEDCWLDTAWLDHRLEETYHEVCADPATALPVALSHAVFAAWDSTAMARRWAEVLFSAGQDSDFGQARTWAQRLTEAIDQNDDGIAYLTALIDEGGLDASARKEAIRMRARAYRDAERYDAALQGFDHAIALDPDFQSAIAGRGETYRLMGRHDEALADLNRAIELDPSDSWAIGTRGQTHHAMGNNDRALADLTRALELDPTSIWIVGSRGDVHSSNSDHDLAVADYDRALELDPTSAWYLSLRGDCHRQAERYSDAIADFTKAIELDPAAPWPVAHRGMTYLSSGRLDDALTDFDRAIELDGSYHWAIAQRGATRVQMGDYDRALADFDRAIELEPTDWVLASRGKALRLLDRYDEAIADYDRAIELDPDYSWALAGRGQTHSLAGDHERAIADFTRAIELSPAYGWAVTRRAASYWSLRRYDDATADYDRAIELDPENGWTWLQRGITHRAAGRPAEAMADLTRALELEPDSAAFHAHRGYALRREGSHDEALADLNRAVELKPDYDWALKMRGRTLMALGRHREAISDLSRAVELDPDDGWALSNRGMALLLSGDQEAAIADLDRAVALRPASGWARYSRGLARGDEADIRAAIGLAAQYVEEDPNAAQERFNIAVYHAALHEYDQAAEVLRDALQRSPSRETVMDFRNDLRDLAVLREVDQDAINALMES